MATRKNTTAPEAEELKQDAAPAAEPEQETKQDQDLAKEVDELKGQYTELKALLQQAIMAMSKTAEKTPEYDTVLTHGSAVARDG